MPAGWTAATLVLRRRVDPVGGLSLVGFASSLAVSLLLHGDPLFLKLQEAPLTGALGIAALGSLVVGRPLAGTLLRLAGRPVPPSQPALARITLIFGLTLVLDACVRLVLAVSLPTAAFLAVHREVSWLILGAGFLSLAALRRRGAPRKA